MNYRRLGNTGLNISEIGLGGNNFGWWADEAASLRVIDFALEQGINFIDTADVYDRGNSERYLGKALRGKRQDVVIATKFGGQMSDDPNDRGGSRFHVIRAAEASLERLQTDYIDLYIMHFPDENTPVEETLRALDDLVRSGKVRYIGCSNFAAWQLVEAVWTSGSLNLHTFAMVQPRYNLLYREIEKELVPCCEEYGIGVIPHSPLASGFLTGKYRKGEPVPEGARMSPDKPMFSRMFTESNYARLEKFRAFAEARGHTVGELAVAWLLSKPWLNSVIAGAKSPEQVSATLAAADWTLTDEEIGEVEKIK